MDTTKKHWKDFSQEEQHAKLVLIAEALKEKDLHTEVKIKESQEVVFTLKGEGKFDSKSDLMIEGEVSASKAENVNDLTKALNEGALKDVSPASYRFDIEVKPSTGGPFIPIKDLVDIYNQEDKSIEHKEGQVLLIDFWATWCPPC